MTLWLNAYIRNMENIAVNIDKLQLLSADTVEMSAVLPVAESGTTIHFYEQYIESLHFMPTKPVRVDEDREIYVRHADVDGSRISEEVIVHFFEKLIPSFFLSAQSFLLQDENVDITCKVKNEQGGLATNTTVHFFERFDYDYLNKGDVVDLYVDSGVSVTSEEGVLRISTSTTNEKRCSYPVALTDNDNFIFECTIAKLGEPQMIALFVKNSSTASGLWVGYENSINRFSIGCMGSTGKYTTSVNVGDKITIKREGGSMSILHNNTTIYTKQANFGGTYYIGHYTNKDRVQYVKNVKITKY